MQQNSNPALENKYRSFFAILENSLKAEFKNSPFPNTRVVNNYARKSEYNVTVELTLAGVPVEVICDTTFPNTDRPKVFCTESFAGELIDKRTREVKYTGFYTWTGRNSKIIDLVTQINNAFKSNPPRKNLLMEENLRRVKEIKDLAAKRVSQGTLGPAEMQSIRDKVNELLDKGLAYTEEIEGKLAVVESIKFATQDRMEEYYKVKQINQGLIESCTALREKFSRQNVNAFLESYLNETRKEIKVLEKQVRDDGLKNPDLLHALCEKNCQRNFYEAIYVKLMDKETN